jgi:hypothetical protein
MQGTFETGLFMKQNYKPVAVLYFDIGTDILTIRDREV